MKIPRIPSAAFMLRARALGSFAVVTGCIAMTGGGVTGIRSVSRAG